MATADFRDRQCHVVNTPRAQPNNLSMLLWKENYESPVRVHLNSIMHFASVSLSMKSFTLGYSVTIVKRSLTNFWLALLTWVQPLGWEDPLVQGMAIHTSILAWGIPWPEQPGRLQSMGCKESDTTERLSLRYNWQMVRNLKYTL